MDRKLNLQDKLNIDSIDMITPDQVIRKIADEIEEITQGQVTGKVEPYSGAVFSHEGSNSMPADAEAPETSGAEDAIQKKLGAIGYPSYNYEFYVTSPAAGGFKYRVMLIEYSAGNYPVKIALAQDIANELMKGDHSDFIFEYAGREELENFIYIVLNSDKMVSVLQQLIRSAKRQSAEDLLSEKIKMVIDILDSEDFGSEDSQEERLDLIRSIHEHLEDEQVLFRITSDLLMCGPTFGEFYDSIIDRFITTERIERFRQYCEELYWDQWKKSFLLFLHAVESKASDGMYIEYGVLKRVFKETEVIRIPKTVHTIDTYAFFDNLPSVTRKIIIPGTVKKLKKAFRRKYSEFEIVYEGTQEEWSSILVEAERGDAKWYKKLNVSFEKYE